MKRNNSELVLKVLHALIRQYKSDEIKITSKRLEVECKWKVIDRKRKENKEIVRWRQEVGCFFLEHLRCQSLSRPLSQYVKLLLPSNGPECLDAYSSSYPSANQQSMPTSTVPMDPLTFHSISAALLPIHLHTTALPVQHVYLTSIHLNIQYMFYPSITQYIQLSSHPSIHPSTQTQEHLDRFKQINRFTWDANHSFVNIYYFNLLRLIFYIFL